MTPQIKLIALYTGRIVQLLKTSHHILSEQVFGSFGLCSIGPVPGILYFVLPEQMLREELYSIENVSGSLCSTYKCLFGVEFLNNGF